VDPAGQSVAAFELDGDFLDAVRRAIGATQLAVVADANARYAVWADALGLLKPGRAFWRFSDAAHRFAGKCLITGLGEDGWPVAFPDTATGAAGATAEEVKAAIAWHPSEDLLSIDERLVLVSDDDGRPVPMIARSVKWKEPDVPASESVSTTGSGGWTVFEREQGGYRAIRYELQGDALEAVEMLSAPNLEALRQLLPPGLIRKEPGELDGDAVVEHYVGGS
jgi:hypothetical protein